LTSFNIYHSIDVVNEIFMKALFMLTKVDKLKNEILEGIKSGRFQPGELLPSRNQFIRRYGYSRGSIDKAIMGLTKAGYLYSSQGAGTYVASKRPKTSVKKIFVFKHRDIPRSQQKYISRPEFISNYMNNIQLEKPVSFIAHNEYYAESILKEICQPGHAAIWERPALENLNILDYLDSAEVPQILIGRNYKKFNYLATDNKAGIAEGMSWLINESSKDVAFISPQIDSVRPYIAERQIAFYESVAKLGANLSSEFIFSDMPFDSIHLDLDYVNSLGNKIFNRQNAPRSICLMDYRLALPLITSAHAYGKMPGRDFYLLIFDDIKLTAQHKGIGMIRQRWGEMERLAIEWIASGNCNKLKREIPPEFITLE